MLRPSGKCRQDVDIFVSTTYIRWSRQLACIVLTGLATDVACASNMLDSCCDVSQEVFGVSKGAGTWLRCWDSKFKYG
ncbi:unnamed protein product [Prunus armeniaca]